MNFRKIRIYLSLFFSDLSLIYCRTFIKTTFNMKKLLLTLSVFCSLYTILLAQICTFDAQITTSDSTLCIGESTLLTFNPMGSSPADTVIATPIVNNNGQDGNMFNITANNTIRIRYFEGNIADSPNTTTEYFIYYKVGTHVGFETNPSAWTLVAGPVNFPVNTPNNLTVIPIPVNIIIPAGQTYAFYLTNTSAIGNNNRYSNGSGTGTVIATNSDITVYEGTGGAYPFSSSYFNARPWEGKIHYDYPPPTLLWSNGATTSSILVQPNTTTSYSCIATFPNCIVQDTIDITVNSFSFDLGTDIESCEGNSVILEPNTPFNNIVWNNGQTDPTITVTTSNIYSATATDINGCTDTDSITVTFHPIPVVDLGNDILSSTSPIILNAGSGFDSYLWSTQDTGQVLVVNTSGTYYVTVTDSNNCMASDTIEVYFTTSLSNELADAKFSVYPNPSSDYITLDLNNLNIENLQIELIDLNGNVIKIWNTGEIIQSYHKQIDIHDLKPGMYILKLITNDSETQLKFVKQ